ncbi:MAG: Holliday junction resolvase RuvX [Acidaminococcaceae bacterium]|nr:Holliday junction resolvase RuvX [Acidaminococcaceae bacterium]
MAGHANTNLQYYLGIDPGRDKTGVALVEETGRILAVQVVRTRNFSDVLLQFLYDTLEANNIWGLRQKLRAVVLGNGTGSEEHKRQIEKALPGFPLYIVDEKYTTEEAKALYWELYPPKGWRMLIPLGLQTPPEPLDGYAAVVQVRRYLEQDGSGT